jgi:hypothetical protein
VARAAHALGLGSPESVRFIRALFLQSNLNNQTLASSLIYFTKARLTSDKYALPLSFQTANPACDPGIPYLELWLCTREEVGLETHKAPGSARMKRLYSVQCNEPCI